MLPHTKIVYRYANVRHVGDMACIEYNRETSSTQAHRRISMSCARFR